MPTPATEQLRLMHEELNRQLGDLSARQSGMNVRSTTLVTAASVVAFGQALGDGAVWASVSAVIVAGIAVLLAVLALVLHISPAAHMGAFPDEELDTYLAADPYSTRYWIWQAGLTTLRNGQADLLSKARLVNASFGVLGLSLVLSIVSIATR